MELSRHPQEGYDPEEAGNVLIASHERDGGAQGAPPIQPEDQEEGYLEQALFSFFLSAFLPLFLDILCIIKTFIAMLPQRTPHYFLCVWVDL